MIRLYSIFSKKKEIFKPIKKTVGIYDCGLTVYDYDHLGHAWKYTQTDLLRRTLNYNKYNVKHVLNITDVGHLTSDADTGEDKMEKSAKKKKKTVWEISEYFTEVFLENRKKLNLLEPHVLCKATDHIKEMISLIEKLFKKGYAYKIEDGIYFDIKKFKRYGKLSGNIPGKTKAGARIEVNPDKRNPEDFALWKFSKKEEKRQMEWNSPWGVGFPGWHIECSAMAMKYLGERIDIHAGGEDNIFPHHESEIAQSEAVTNKKFVNIWFHPRFLKVEGQKMSKSLKNFYTINDIEKKGFNPLSLRYLFLTSHYRTPLNFTWESLKAAETALNNLYNIFLSLEKGKGNINKKYKEEFKKALNNDLNLPQAVSSLWKLIKDKKIKDKDKRETLLDFDKVLALNLKDLKKKDIPEEIEKLAKERENQRKNKNWEESDKIRKEIEKKGYKIEDKKDGYVISLLNS